MGPDAGQRKLGTKETRTRVALLAVSKGGIGQRQVQTNGLGKRKWEIIGNEGTAKCTVIYAFVLRVSGSSIIGPVSHH